LIGQRGYFTDSEAARVEDAFKLQRQPLANLPKRQRNYLRYLQRVEEVTGVPSMISLSAAGLGPSTVYSMRDDVRAGLPSKIRDQISNLDNAVLRRLTKDYIPDSSEGKYYPK
jgi:ribosomal protein S30